MNWGKLKSIHYHENPVSHIYSHAIVEPKEYDNLYENQNDLNHQVWQEFDENTERVLNLKVTLTT